MARLIRPDCKRPQLGDLNGTRDPWHGGEAQVEARRQKVDRSYRSRAQISIAILNMVLQQILILKLIIAENKKPNITILLSRISNEM